MKRSVHTRVGTILITIGVALMSQSAVLAGIPSPSNTSTDIYADPMQFCTNADLTSYLRTNIDNEALVVAVTVRDDLLAPVAACSLRLDYGGSFSVHPELDPNIHPYRGYLCGTGVAFAVTDTLGSRKFESTQGEGVERWCLMWS